MRATVERISYADAKPFVLGIHYARKMPCVQYAYGLFTPERELIGVVTYGQPASPWLCIGVAGRENRHRVLELNRLVIKPGCEGRNCASFLVGRSLKMLPPHMIIVSYADWGGWGHVGYVYQATNWIYTGMTKRRTDIWSAAGHSRHHCGDTSKRQIRTEKHRYVFVTGRDKNLLMQIKYPQMPYPKGDSRRYDPENPVSRLKEIENDGTGTGGSSRALREVLGGGDRDHEEDDLRSGQPDQVPPPLPVQRELPRGLGKGSVVLG